MPARLHDGGRSLADALFRVRKQNGYTNGFYNRCAEIERILANEPNPDVRLQLVHAWSKYLLEARLK